MKKYVIPALAFMGILGVGTAKRDDRHPLPPGSYDLGPKTKRPMNIVDSTSSTSQNEDCIGCQPCHNPCPPIQGLRKMVGAMVAKHRR